MRNIEKLLATKLAVRETNNNLRKLTVKPNLIDFSSNDYLGISRNEEVCNIIEEEYNKLKISFKNALGATGSRLLTGNSEYIENLEKYIAEVYNTTAALLFNSGYMANMAILSSIPQKGDTIIYDELSHACIKDGARLSLANRYSFKHNNTIDLELKLSKATGNIFVVTESVFSMDGDMAPLAEISTLVNKYHANLIVDEAHATGILGKNGSGLCNELNIDVFVKINTFGKAVGTHGAVVCCSETVKDYLINFARPFIYTTALPLHNLVSIKKIVEYLVIDTLNAEKLGNNINYFNRKINYSNINTPIKSLVFSGNEKVKNISIELEKVGIDARPILSPTVKEGTERIRICLHSYNTFEEIDLLCNTINRYK